MNSKMKVYSVVLLAVTLLLAILTLGVATAQGPDGGRGFEPGPVIVLPRTPLPVVTPLPPSTSPGQPTSRTFNSETVSLGAGRYRVRIGSEPRYYQDANGAWHTIDPTLRLETKGTRAEYVSDHGLVHVRLPARLGTGPIQVSATAYVPQSTTPAMPGYGDTMPVPASNPPGCGGYGSSDQPATLETLNACPSSGLKATPLPGPPTSRTALLAVSGELAWTPLRLAFVDASGHQEVIDQAAQVEGVSQGNVLTYPSTFPGITERFTVHPAGLKHEVILSSPAALPSTGLSEGVSLDYQGMITMSPGLAIYVDGVRQDGDLTASALELRDSSGRPVLYLPPVLAYEQANPANSVGGHYAIRRTSESLLLSFGVPHGWLTDPQREYPVVVDPTVYIWPPEEDALVWSSYPDANYGSYPELWVGDSFRSLIEWDLSSLPERAMVEYSEAIIELVNTDGSDLDVSAHALTRSWTEDGVTWNSRNGTDDWNTAGGDFDSFVEDVVSVGTVTDTLYGWALADLVAEWHSGNRANYGILLQPESYPASATKRFGSKEGDGWRPELDVVYTEGPVGLSPDVPFAWGVPSPDWYSLSRGSLWNAVAMRPPAGSDYDLRLSSTDEYADTLVWSSYGGDIIDFVLIDGNHAPSGNYYPSVWQYSGRGRYRIEHATHTADLGVGTTGPYVMSPSDVVRVWDIRLYDGTTYYIGVKPTAGDADLGVALHKSETVDSDTWYQGRADGVALADQAGSGTAEFFDYTAPETDWYGLVVVNDRPNVPLAGAYGAAGAGRILGMETRVGAKVPTNLGVTRVAQPTSYHYQASSSSQLSSPSQLAQLNILLCSDSCQVSPPDTCAEVALQNLGESYDLYFQDWEGCETAINSGAYDVAIIDNACYSPEDSLFTALDDFLAGGGQVVINTFDMDAFPANSLWETVGVAYVSNVTTEPPVYRWNPSHPAISDWPADPLVFADPAYFDDGDKLDAVAGTQLLAGYTAAPAAGEGAFALRGDNRAVVISFCIDNLAASDQDGDGTFDCIEVWQDAISQLSPPTSYMIYVDTTEPGGAFEINGGDAYANSTTVTLNVSATDAETGIGDVRFENGSSLRALVFQDSYPWGSDAIQQTLAANNVPYDQLESSDIATADLEPYWMVIIPSVQGDVFCNVYNDNLSKFEDYVQNGGILELHGATYSSNACRPMLPGGGVNNQDFQSYNYIVSPAHPLVAGVPNPLYGTVASHNSFTGHPGNATVLATAGSAPGGDATLIEYALGSGRVIASGQTLEYGWSRSQSAGTILVNVIPYVAGHAAWATEIPWVLPPSDGVKTVYGEFRNNAGMWSPVREDTITLDTQPPSSSASSPNYDNGGSIPVDWSASDGLSGVANTSLWYKRGTGGSWTDSGLTQSGTSGAFNFSPPGGTNGTYYFATRATDNATNAESAPSGGGDDSTVYDTVSPTASASCPPETDQTSFVVSWSGSDGLSGIGSYDVQYRVDVGGTWTAWKTGTTATSATFGPSAPVTVEADRTYYFRARAQDRAGNQGQYAGGDGDCSIQVTSPEPEEKYVYLPIVMRNLVTYALPCGPANNYCEDYDTLATAYGSLEPGASYRAYPDDENDYYYIWLANPASLTVQVTGYQAVGQLIVYDEDVTTLGRDWNNPGDDGVMTIASLSLGAGKYYIRVYTASGQHSTALYTLTVTY